MYIRLPHKITISSTQAFGARALIITHRWFILEVGNPTVTQTAPTVNQWKKAFSSLVPKTCRSIFMRKPYAQYTSLFLPDKSFWASSEVNIWQFHCHNNYCDTNRINSMRNDCYFIENQPIYSSRISILCVSAKWTRFTCLWRNSIKDNLFLVYGICLVEDFYGFTLIYSKVNSQSSALECPHSDRGNVKIQSLSAYTFHFGQKSVNKNRDFDQSITLARFLKVFNWLQA